MSEFRFQPHEPIDDGVRRIALVQAELAHSATSRGLASEEEALRAHAALSGLLSVLSLARGAIDEDDFESLLSLLRPAAERIHRAHDKHAIRGVHSRFGSAAPDSIARPHDSEQVGANEDDSSLAALPERLRELQLNRTGFDAIEPGLERTLSTARERFFTARDAPTTEAVRMWLGSVHSMAGHARLLQDIRRPALGKRIRRLDALVSILEEHLALGLALESAQADGAPADHELLAPIESERAGLESGMSELGTRLFQAPPRKLLRRWRRWWDAWAESITPAEARDSAPVLHPRP